MLAVQNRALLEERWRLTSEPALLTERQVLLLSLIHI